MRTPLTLFLVAAAAIAWAADRSQPPPAVTMPATVVDVHDGDTLTVEIRLPIRVRLLNCWSPELREPGGEAARDHLRKLALGKKCLLHLPLDGARRTDDVLTFGRLLARVWIDGDSVDVSAKMVADGHATREKRP